MADIVTRQMRAKRAAHDLKNWCGRTEYWHTGWPHLEGGVAKNPPGKDTYAALVALGETPSPDDVERVTGYRNITFGACDECGQPAATTAVFDINCGEFEVELCQQCCLNLATAISLAS